MLMDSHFHNDGVVANVRDAVIQLDSLFGSKDVNSLYKDLKIVL